MNYLLKYPRVMESHFFRYSLGRQFFRGETIFGQSAITSDLGWSSSMWERRGLMVGWR